MAETSVPQGEIKVKRCPRCKKNLPAMNFSHHKGAFGNLNWCCKPCAVEYLRVRKANRTTEDLRRIEQKQGNPKRCPRCEETKPRSDYFLSPWAYDGKAAYCKSCTSIYAKKIRERNKAENKARTTPVTDRVCVKCGKRKPRNEFHAAITTRDGLTSRCIECRKEAYKRPPSEKGRLQRRMYFFKRRMKVLAHYGGPNPKCALCGETYVELLAIDHVNGGGHQHLLKRKVAELAFWITKNGFPPGFRVLCYNCNTVTGFRKPTSFTRKAEILRKWKRNLKRRVLAHYGGDPPKCACCGTEKVDFLSIDHHGAEIQKKYRSGGNLYHWIHKNGYPSGFRVLCYNCNCSLGFHGYCPHVTSSKSRQ